MSKQNEPLIGFEAIYQIDQEKLQSQAENQNSEASKLVSKSVSNIITVPTTTVFEATTFKADRRKVMALKRLTLDLNPPRKLQDLFDEALTDLLLKYGRNPDETT